MSIVDDDLMVGGIYDHEGSIRNWGWMWNMVCQLWIWWLCDYLG